ncbi:MAG: LuxR family transcriptional regulator [Sphingomonas hengshuiensis]|nr:MAG: LuxR family transcriptional regulator [Sphingomonas hengshuiensis]
MRILVSEIVCLRWASEGNCVGQIAVLEGWPVETVAVHVTSALAKLSASSLREAVEYARTSRLI